jgi:hypothetical protein
MEADNQTIRRYFEMPLIFVPSILFEFILDVALKGITIASFRRVQYLEIGNESADFERLAVYMNSFQANSKHGDITCN